MDTAQSTQALWPLWKKIIFRFIFIYLALQIAPWTWLKKIPFGNYPLSVYNLLMNWAVNAANAKVFHVKKALVPVNGSGDTSFAWAQLWMFISIALIGCAVWSVLDRKRSNYTNLNYWLCLVVRYYIALTAFTYGIIKIFGFQMHFPHLYEMATQLGDFLPMHLSWMFIGYSTPYQAFAGVMEVLAGSLLLYRRTTTLGVMVATAVFINVMMLNLCYDIPVKILSMQLVFACLYLLTNESNRIICFFILNKPADTCSVYHFNYTKQWMRVTRRVVKLVFILFVVVIPFLNCLWSVLPSTSSSGAVNKKAIENGLYDVTEYSLRKRNMPLLATDTLRWEDLILEDGTGSVKTNDTTFHHTYNRAYFGYTVDSAKHIMAFTRSNKAVFTMQYTFPDTNTIKLWGKKGNDSLFIGLKKSKHHFQLAEKQFHWLSEDNR